MQKGDLALIVRDRGWQNSHNRGLNGVGHIVEIVSLFDDNPKSYETTSDHLGKWWCMEEEICKIPEELKNEPIEVIKLYCNL